MQTLAQTQAAIAQTRRRASVEAEAAIISSTFAGGVAGAALQPLASDGLRQSWTFNGALTLTCPDPTCSLVLSVTNGATPGAVAFSGFDLVTGAFTLVPGDIFKCFIEADDIASYLNIVPI